MRQRGYLQVYLSQSSSFDDADAAAGTHRNESAAAAAGAVLPTTNNKTSNTSTPPTPPPDSSNSRSSVEASSSDLEFFEDVVSEPVLVLGVDISQLTRREQYWSCATGTFIFSLTYGYLQELISVELADRKLGLFLAICQFSGYTVLAYLLRTFVYRRQQRQHKQRRQQQQQQSASSSGEAACAACSSLVVLPTNNSGNGVSGNNSNLASAAGLQPHHVPFLMYLGMSLLRAVDMAMTNLAMQYINYPAKTLMKSSKTVWTMIFGVVIGRKVYKIADYAIVLAMVLGLALFMHADANTAAVFGIQGVVMLTISLICDGAIGNMSETIMSKYGVGQDEFIFRMYSIALLAITVAATAQGDLVEGMRWIRQPGTYDELLQGVPVGQRTWSVAGKIAVLLSFSTMGFFGSSCSAAITKNFGALAMSINATARKATTLFLAFFLFKHNVCTQEHVTGIVIFISALVMKSYRRGRKRRARRYQRSSTTSVASEPMSDLQLEIPAILQTKSRDNPAMTSPSQRLQQVSVGTPSKPVLAAAASVPTRGTVNEII